MSTRLTELYSSNVVEELRELQETENTLPSTVYIMTHETGQVRLSRLPHLILKWGEVEGGSRSVQWSPSFVYEFQNTNRRVVEGAVDYMDTQVEVQTYR